MKYAKYYTALVTGLIGWGAVYLSPEYDMWIALATVVATSLGVYAVPNKVADDDTDDE